MATVASQLRHAQLRSRLKDAGFSRVYVKRALPEWWDNGLWETDSGFAQGAMILSRNLGVDIQSLYDSSGMVQFKAGTRAKFKYSSSTAKSDVVTAESVSLSAARIAAACMRVDCQSIPRSASEIRGNLLDFAGQQTVHLGNLLDYCWNSGIPVLHVSRFPAGHRKFDGMAATVDGRPVIVISKKMKFAAWQVFILAHELGHICLGHVPEGSALVDEQVEVKDKESGQTDEEKDANRFAKELLLGDADLAYGSPHRLKGAQLAEAARRTGLNSKSDPGVIALNYAHTSNFIPVGMSALQRLEPSPDAVGMINQKMLANLDGNMIPKDSFAWLRYLTAADNSRDSTL